MHFASQFQDEVTITVPDVSFGITAGMIAADIAHSSATLK